MLPHGRGFPSPTVRGVRDLCGVGVSPWFVPLAVCVSCGLHGWRRRSVCGAHSLRVARLVSAGVVAWCAAFRPLWRILARRAWLGPRSPSPLLPLRAEFLPVWRVYSLAGRLLVRYAFRSFCGVFGGLCALLARLAFRPSVLGALSVGGFGDPWRGKAARSARAGEGERQGVPPPLFCARAWVRGVTHLTQA